MKRYRISKFSDYIFKYTDWLNYEWSDFGDIGQEFHGKVLTYEEYKETEDGYIQSIVDILKYLNIKELKRDDCIVNFKREKRLNGTKISIDEFCKIFRQMLRNESVEIYGKLVDFGCSFVGGKTFRLRLGYDYVMYVSCNMSLSSLKKICSKHNLYCADYWDK